MSSTFSTIDTKSPAHRFCSLTPLLPYIRLVQISGAITLSWSAEATQ